MRRLTTMRRTGEGQGGTGWRWPGSTGPRRRRAVLCAGAALAAVAAAVAVNAGTGSSAAAPVVARPQGIASDFRLASVTSAGRVQLSQARGRPVLLSFFASWCDNCRQELQTMAGLARSAGAKVQVIGIDVNDQSGPARQLLAQDRIDYPVGTDDGGVIALRYGLVGLPTTVYLDAAHRIVGRTVGALTPASGRAWLAAMESPAA